jgi:hypothetical protein
MRMILLRHAVRRCNLARAPLVSRSVPSALRTLSSTPPVPASSAEPDWVRSAIQKMMEECQHHQDDAVHATAGTDAPQDLQKALLSLQVRWALYHFLVF